MQSEELSFPEKSERYNYQFEELRYDTYSFQTANGLLYEVIFKPSPYIFGEEAIYAPYLYELLIVIRQEGNKKIELDKRISFTIVSILLDFYSHNDNNVCIYICDSSDGKQLVRERKFNAWFNYFNAGGFIKLSDSVKDESGIEFPIGVILKIKNSFRNDIIDAFEKFVALYDKDQ